MSNTHTLTNALCRRLCPNHPVAVDLLLPTSLPESNSRASVAAAVPPAHQKFVTEATMASMRAFPT